MHEDEAVASGAWSDTRLRLDSSGARGAERGAAHCGCSVYTTFEGEVEGDVIEGTFRSRPGHVEPYEGTWLVRRQKKGDG